MYSIAKTDFLGALRSRRLKGLSLREAKRGPADPVTEEIDGNAQSNKPQRGNGPFDPHGTVVRVCSRRLWRHVFNVPKVPFFRPPGTLKTCRHTVLEQTLRLTKTAFYAVLSSLI